MNPLGTQATTVYPSATKAWWKLLHQLLVKASASETNRVKPRGMATTEILNASAGFDMDFPVVCSPGRKLNYSFMAAEAFWITSGDNRVETIAPYNPNISQFSDDGVIFNGAYGPPYNNQFSYVVKTLLSDKDTRQATMTIWKPNPKKSKDIPCTVALVFNIRYNKLNLHVFMRSSDIWLGVPYDFFNFTMMALKVLCRYNLGVGVAGQKIAPGTLYFTAVSSHLYERDREKARDVVNDMSTTVNGPFQQSHENLMDHDRLYSGDWSYLEASMLACRDRVPSAEITERDLWRIRYADVL